jgi:PhnB protein
MAARLNPYLHFGGNAREALEFYHDVFGGKLSVQTFAESHVAEDPSEEQLVVHGSLEADHGMVLMASDTPKRMGYVPGTNFSLYLTGEDDALLRGHFERLAEGGTVTQPLVAIPSGDTFGMCDDRFGIGWLVAISPKAE